MMLCSASVFRERVTLLRETQAAWGAVCKEWAAVETLERREDYGGMSFGMYGYPDDGTEMDSEVVF